MRKMSPATKYILQALVPYTKANLQLAFKPSLFYRELGQLKNIKPRTVETAYYRAIKEGLIEVDNLNNPRLTDKGARLQKLFQPTKLGNDAKLILIFDIPEAERKKRDHLRILLKELSFKKVQQSVWESKYDYRELVMAEIEEYDLQNYVQLYEALKI